MAFIDNIPHQKATNAKPKKDRLFRLSASARICGADFVTNGSNACMFRHFRCTKNVGAIRLALALRIRKLSQGLSLRCWAGVLSTVLFMNCSPAAAQQSGEFPNLGRIGPSKAQVVGAIIGAAVVIGVVAYLVVPKKTTIEGCVEPDDASGSLRLTNKKENRRYILLLDKVPVRAGHSVVLKGKKRKMKSGDREFAVTKLLKDEAACADAKDTAAP